MENFEIIKTLLLDNGAMSLEDITNATGIGEVGDYVLEGKLVMTKKGKFALPVQMGLLRAIIQGHAKGFGFAITDEGDYFISPANLKGAIHGDTVFIGGINHRDRSAKVMRILKYTDKPIVGTFKQRGKGLVIPDDRRIPDVWLGDSNTIKPQHDDKVVVELIRIRGNIYGKVTEIIGNTDAVGVDIKSVVRQFGIRDTFDSEVVAWAGELPTEVTDIEGRLDLRNERIFTIDGEDAKDFDDAVSIRELSDGNLELGVHIADVSHYVTEDCPIDKEAMLRGTSVYLLDRVIPMLPFELSNELCSLKPKVDRLAVSVFMAIDGDGEVVDRRFATSVIRSVERMTYTKVTGILNGDEKLIEQYSHIHNDLKLMERLMKILSDKRTKRGALDFNSEEAEITLDESGKPIEIKRRERQVSHRMIEEFMIVCNETVAEYLFWANQQSIYRVHERPDQDRMRTLGNLLGAFGYRIKGSEIHPNALQSVLNRAKGREEEMLVNRMMIRSLRKAFYSTENLKHFGLASDCYCHFTSPIRRYPDLVVHRQLKSLLESGLTETSDLSGIASHSSITERNADDAERTVDDMKKAEYMQEHIGEKYDGMVSGITNYGFYVELPNTVEGLVRLSDLSDHYEFNEKLLLLVGRRGRKTIRIGNRVRVKVKAADKLSGTVDFQLMEESLKR